MTKHPDLFAALAAPFDNREIKTLSKGGRKLSYVTARTVVNRLDIVLGPENWWDDYRPGEHSVECRLTIRLPDGETLTKCDAGAYAGMADQGDDDKSGYSDAIKRAAAKFGVGRYLYGDGVPHHDPTSATNHEPDPRPAEHQISPHQGQIPRSGKALFAWCKDQEQKHQVGILKWLMSWAKLQEFPARMVDWDADQTALAHAEAMRKLSRSPESSPSANGQACSSGFDDETHDLDSEFGKWVSGWAERAKVKRWHIVGKLYRELVAAGKQDQTTYVPLDLKGRPMWIVVSDLWKKEADGWPEWMHGVLDSAAKARAEAAK